VKARFAQIAKSLPEGVTLKAFYDRTDLVRRTIKTVEANLIEGAALVIAVLFLVLGNIRAAIVVALSIPLSMLFAVSFMVKLGIAGSLMSLGAIAFGLIVDGSVVMVENTLRRLAERRQRGGRLLPTIVDACAEVGRPIIFGVGIIIVVYLPILSLQSVEGKLFIPMALTVVLALAGSLLLTFTVTPVLSSLLLRGRISEREVALIRWIKRVYAPLLTWCLRRRLPVLGAAGRRGRAPGRPLPRRRVHPSARRGRDRAPGAAPAQRLPRGVDPAGHHGGDPAPRHLPGRDRDHRHQDRPARDRHRPDGREHQRHDRHVEAP
jgi:cobalt-zinc-cadmium resistance protein CzcA